ncbi:MAG TPA: hypothetical protein EYP14_06155, partial [Planctomycetaceae bacterium]|nr:hypothetical protein [Planctomycetaceae bacterium]
MSVHSEPIRGYLQRVKGRIRTIEFGFAFAVIASIVLGVVVVEVILDHLFVLQRATRVAILSGLKIGVLCLAFVSAVRICRRIGDLYAARLVERGHPEMKNVLVSYLQAQADANTPQEIVELLERRTATALAQIPPESVVDVRPVTNVCYVTLCLLLFFAGYAGLSTKSVGTSLMRVLFPHREILPPTRTRILAVEPGNRVVQEGHPVNVRVRIGGVEPEDAQIVWTTDMRRWSTVDLAHTQGETIWLGVLPICAKRTTYFIQAGDTKSDRYEITTVPPPLVQLVEIELSFPAYTKLPTRT